MFSSSVRRVASATAPSSITSSISTSAPRAATSQALSYSCHQRRHSSSKPSSPAGGSKGIADGQTVPATAVKKKSEESQTLTTTSSKSKPDGDQKASSASKKKAKAKDTAAHSSMKGSDESMLHLPSVPSTQHISASQIATSALFALHRPISLTHGIPKTVTDEAFASIFTPRTKSNSKPSDVISTLSNTLKNIDAVTGNPLLSKISGGQDQWNEERDEIRASITADSYRDANMQHLDSPPEDGGMSVWLAKYQPFKPPPAPKPMNTSESLAAGAEAAELQEPQHRTYTALLTIEESTDAHGEVTYSAHSSAFVAEDPPATPTRFLERMQNRQERYREQRAEENEMLAISVKRQRKLKMKKHKYKKLMRKTRNLRRRLDRN